MRPVPYIGVTGFMHSSEVHAGLNAFHHDSAITARKLMVGVLASSKSLAGVPNKWPNRYPKPETLSGIFRDDPRALNLIHYATDTKATLGIQLDCLIGLGGPLLHGFQLNVTWPEPDELDIVKGMRVVLQLGNKALHEAGNNPEAVAASLDEYEGLITDVLIDGSAGYGVPMNAGDVLRYASCIAKAHPELGIGIAGGLSATTLDTIRPVAETFAFVSIDAEGRLRTDDDHLDIPAMQAYIRTAAATLD